MAKRFVSSGSVEVDRALIALQATFPDLSVFEGVRQLDGIALEDGVTRRIAHGLGRKLRGWLVVRISSGDPLSALYDEQSMHNDTDKYLYLRADGFAPTLSLLVF